MSANRTARRDVRQNARARARRHVPDEARREIVDSAVRFLWQRPFRDLTVGQLMAGTSLSRPSFYQYFDDLHDLICSLLSDIESVMRRTANPWLAGEGDPVGAIRDALAGVVQTSVDHGPILRAVSEAAPLDERLERAWSAFMERWDDAVEARIRAQQGEGLISTSLDARRVANALNAMDAAVLIAEFGRRPQGDAEAVLDTLYGIWRGALYCPATPREHGGAQLEGTQREGE